MSLLVVLGIWIAASAVFTPLVGYFLSDAAQKAAERKARRNIEANLGNGAHPPA
jgi:hypothetical protein